MKPIEKVLVIDDDPTSIYLTKRVLQSLNITESQTQAAFDGLEGLNLIKKAFEQKQLPQLILLDIKMPVMDGFAFLEELVKLQNINLTDTKIILLSSSHNPWEVTRAQQSPIAAFLNKPLTKEKLQQVIS